LLKTDKRKDGFVKKTIKAWAVIDETGTLFHHRTGPWLDIQDEKPKHLVSMNESAVPCTITYTIPTKKKRR